MPGSNSGIQSFSTENSSESDEQHLLGATQQKNAGRGGKQWSKQASTLLDRLAPQSRGFQSVQSHDMQISDVNDTNYIPQRYGAITLDGEVLGVSRCEGYAAT